jgi:integrase
MASDLFLNEIKRCKNAGLGNTRPNELLKTLRTTISYAANHFGVDMKDPTKGIKKLPRDIKTKFIPTEEMIEEILDSCNSDQKRLIQFVYETGCRIGECLSLDYEDVHDDYVTLYTRKSLNSQRTPRHLPRPESLKDGEGKVFKHNAYPRFLEEKVKGLGH